MSQPVSEGRGEKPPGRSPLPLLAAAVVFFAFSAGVFIWGVRALIKTPPPPVQLASAPVAVPAPAAPAATPHPSVPQIDLQELAARRRSELMGRGAAPNDQPQPARTIAGRVLTADGRPAAGAQVYLAAGTEPMIVADGRVLRHAPATADADGHFEISTTSDVFLILAFNDDGCVMVDQNQFAKGTDLKLSAWGRIEGRAMIGNAPAIRQTVNVFPIMSINGWPIGETPFMQHGDAMTDETGRFVFTRLVPGFFSVGRVIDSPDASDRIKYVAINIETSVASGAAANVMLGGTGRPVTGRVVLSDSSRRLQGSFAMAGARSTLWSIPQPPDVQSMSEKDRIQWQENWRKSELGKALNAAEREGRANGSNYMFPVGPDGRFRIDDVVPGDYRLNFSFVPDRKPDVYTPSINAYSQFTMPPIDGSRSDEPLVLPDIQTSPR